MNDSFLGRPNRKIQEFFESKIETEDGQWIIYDESMKLLFSSNSYDNTTEEGRVWKNTAFSGPKIIFGRDRGPIPIPMWQVWYPNGKISVTSDNIQYSKAKTLTAENQDTHEKYILKWSSQKKKHEWNFKVTSGLSFADDIATISITYRGQTYSKEFKEETSIFEGTEVTYFIKSTHPNYAITKINGQSVGSVLEYESKVIINKDTTITVDFGN